MSDLLHRAAFALLLACAGLACACSTPAAAVAAQDPLHGATQLVVVTSAGWDSSEGQLQAFTRSEDGWRAHGDAFPVSLGRSGSAWGIGLHAPQAQGPQKREGDGRSPAGAFALGSAFGYAAQADTGMHWEPMLETSYCMDVPDSPYYNRIVDAARVGNDAVEGSTEPMRLDLHNNGDVRYQQGLVIEHNPRNVPGQGSCIFAHLWRTPGEATAGCTAMPAARMQSLLAWLQPAAKPRFVLLPRAQYQQLQVAWQLPVLPAPAATAAAPSSAGSAP